MFCDERERLAGGWNVSWLVAAAFGGRSAASPSSLTAASAFDHSRAKQRHEFTNLEQDIYLYV